LSHDEVVHGKKSLIDKMPGDIWQKFANLRAYMGYFYTHPGKTLMFMGGEFGQFQEWAETRELDWFLLTYPMHQRLEHFHQTFKKIMHEEDALYSQDHVPEGFEWIDQYNADQSIVSYTRIGSSGDHIVVVLNLTPVTYHDYQLGVPQAGVYDELLNSDQDTFGGSNLYNGAPLKTTDESAHGKKQSIYLTLSPLSVALLKWRRV
jgi:1,4-alpha-glucan branching enzyme